MPFRNASGSLPESLKRCLRLKFATSAPFLGSFTGVKTRSWPGPPTTGSYTLHLFTLSNTEGWTYAQEALKHYGTKLLQFHRTTTSPLVCLLKIYLFLHDAHCNDFHSAKLQEKWNHAMLAKISALELGSGKGGPATHRCKKCGLDTNPGGVMKCWFCNLLDTEAKKRTAKLMTKLGKMSSNEINALVGGSSTVDEE